MLIYCQTLNMCSLLFALFQEKLCDQSYYPADTLDKVCKNHLFGMYHAGTPDSNKKDILQNLSDSYGIVCIIFSTNALGMGVNLAGVNTIVHYGAPRSMEDYLQECGRVGRAEEQTCFYYLLDSY